MGRGVSALSSSDAWRVAALTMMRDEDLAAILSGESALLWIRPAANLGIPEAQLRLGRMLLAGESVSRDSVRAFALFCSAAAQGNADAENMVGRCHENGWGTETDFAQAAHWYRKAAEKGLAWAQYNLGHLLLDGNGVTGNRHEAFLWYSRAAEQGHARAMNLVARCCEEGWGTARDEAAARDWYRRSAEAGYFRGAYNHASILAAEGNRAEAEHWFKAALANAPERTRSAMQKALRQQTNGVIPLPERCVVATDTIVGH